VFRQIRGEPLDRPNATLSTGGYGVGRYITDLGTLGGQQIGSTFTYGTVVVDNIAVQPGDSFHMTNRGSVNLTWSPIPRLDLVAEFLFGNRINKDRQRGSSSQLQLGSNFRF
jgi:hypothetical protein